MWLPRIPRRDPDCLYAAALTVGLPAILLILRGAPIVPTLVIAALAGAVLIAIR